MLEGVPKTLSSLVACVDQRCMELSGFLLGAATATQNGQEPEIELTATAVILSHPPKAVQPA
jgi:hypothetical protein